MIRGGALSDSVLGNEAVFALSPWNRDEGQGPVCGGGRRAGERDIGLPWLHTLTFHPHRESEVRAQRQNLRAH